MMRNILLTVGLVLIAGLVGCGSSATPTTPAPQPVQVQPTLAPVVIEFHRQGGVAGLCDDATIHAEGVIEYHTCGRPVQTATLTPEEREQLAGWVSEFDDFAYTHEDNPGGPDNMVRELKFDGRGATAAPDQRQAEILTWVEGIYGELVQQPVPGSATTTAGRVLDVMNKEVIVIRPDQPGQDLIAVTEDTQFTWDDGSSASLTDVQPGVYVQVEGEVLGAGGMRATSVTVRRDQ